MKPTHKDEVAAVAKKIRERLTSNGWVKIPPGWSLVPDHPTPEMMKAAEDAQRAARHTVVFTGDDEGTSLIYYAMVKAAPSFADLFPR